MEQREKLHAALSPPLVSIFQVFKNFIFALAPMAGVTDFAFRKICSDFGADMVVTEMISAKALEYNNSKVKCKLINSS